MVVPSLSPAPTDKVALRQLAREHRRAFVRSLSEERRGEAEQELARLLLPLLAGSKVVGGYCPLSSEISPLPALGAAAAAGVVVAYPAFAADQQAEFRFLAGEPTEAGPFACLQPPPEAPQVRPDLVLVPLVAVDMAGTRLGQGKGHYDRVLGALRDNGALLIGLGWPVQMLGTTIPPDPWDIPLHGFASPEGLEMFR